MVSDGGIRHNFTFVGGGNISTIGGIVRTITQIANDLAEQGHEVRYLAKLRSNEKPFYDLHKNVIVEPIDYPHASSQIPKFAERLSQLKTDVLIVALSGKLALNVMKATEDLPFPIVRSEHGNPLSLLNSSLVWNKNKTARALTFQMADYSHVLYSQFAEQPDLGEAVKKNLKAIPSPIDLDVKRANPSQPNKNGRKKIIYSGRIEKFEKNAGVLLDSFLQLAGEFPDWECHYLGDGELRVDLENTCSKHPNGSQVVFHGSVSEAILFEHLASANMFVIPSDTEGCPMALGEALAHGLPAIGFADCEGVNKMIQHEHNGLLVGYTKHSETDQSPKGFAEENIAIYQAEGMEQQGSHITVSGDQLLKQTLRSYSLENCMKTLMLSPDLCARYGENGPASVMQYERSKVLQEWGDFLTHIAKQNVSIFDQRTMRRETYPELVDVFKDADEMIKQISPAKKSGSFFKRMISSVLDRS